MRPCTYCGEDASGSGSLYAHRVMGNYAEACPGCAFLLNAEGSLWVGLQLRTFAIPQIRRYVIGRAFSTFQTHQLVNLINYKSEMRLNSSDESPRWYPGQHLLDFKWEPYVIAFGLERIRELEESGKKFLGRDDIFGEEGFHPPEEIDGHFIKYAFMMSSSDEIREIARKVLQTKLDEKGESC